MLPEFPFFLFPSLCIPSLHVSLLLILFFMLFRHPEKNYHEINALSEFANIIQIEEALLSIMMNMNDLVYQSFSSGLS